MFVEQAIGIWEQNEVIDHVFPFLYQLLGRK